MEGNYKISTDIDKFKGNVKNKFQEFEDRYIKNMLYRNKRQNFNK